MRTAQTQRINLWKDKKFLLGLCFTGTSLLLGLVGKIAFFANITNGYRWAGIGIYLAGWVLLITGVFLIGKEAMLAAKSHIHGRIRHHSKKGIEHVSRLHKIIFRNSQTKKESDKND